MDDNFDHQLLDVQFLVDNTDELKKDSDELNKKPNNHYIKFSNIKTLLNQFLVHNQISRHKIWIHQRPNILQLLP